MHGGTGLVAGWWQWAPQEPPSPKQRLLCPPRSGHCFHIMLQTQAPRFSHCCLPSSLLNPKPTTKVGKRPHRLSPRYRAQAGLAPCLGLTDHSGLATAGPPARTEATLQPAGRGRRQTRSLGHGLGKYPLWDSLSESWMQEQGANAGVMGPCSGPPCPRPS